MTLNGNHADRTQGSLEPSPHLQSHPMRHHPVELRGIRTCFGKTCIHENLDLAVNEGEILALVGASGSGKSVLLREMILLMRPTAGRVRLFGEETQDLDESASNRLRRRIGITFQHGALFNSLTVIENISVPLKEQTDLSNPVIRDIAMLKLLLAGLSAEAANKYPSQLSGGMHKRAALARALAMDPDLLVLDEPGTGLDPVGADALDELIKDLQLTLGLTVIMTTHDLDTLWRVSDRVAFLGQQRILATGTMAELTASPDPALAAFFQGTRARAARRLAWNQG
jgi:phospholipid/cholesterol/gamma-HCH transport system ATP-binding protein